MHKAVSLLIRIVGLVIHGADLIPKKGFSNGIGISLRSQRKYSFLHSSQKKSADK
jgi:hypothetical protein